MWISEIELISVNPENPGPEIFRIYIYKLNFWNKTIFWEFLEKKYIFTIENLKKC